MIRKTIIAVLFVFVSVVFAGNPYFPLELGNRWTYQSRFLVSVNTYSETVIEERTIGQESYFFFDNFRLQTSVPFRAEGQQVVTFAEGVKYLMYDFTADVGTSWTSPDPPKPIMGRMTMVGKSDTIVTPAGTFTDCYHFRHYFGVDMVYDEWFAPGVGIVKKNVRILSGLIESVLVDHHVTTAVRNEPTDGPSGYTLHGNYPNLFNSSTTISFEAPGGETSAYKSLIARGGLSRIFWTIPAKEASSASCGIQLINGRASTSFDCPAAVSTKHEKPFCNSNGIESVATNP